MTHHDITVTMTENGQARQSQRQKEFGMQNASSKTQRTMAESPTNAESTSSNANSDKVTIAKLSTQLKKINEANGKYKNLLQLAKERIQQQESQLKEIKIASEKAEAQTPEDPDLTTEVVRVCQCVLHSLPNSRSDDDNSETSNNCEVWALLESETSNADQIVVSKTKEWRKFGNMTMLSDYIRRDAGREPLHVPPVSLSPHQSAELEREYQTKLQSVSEEFRRFRVKAELARKQADAHLKNFQSNRVVAGNSGFVGNENSNSNQDGAAASNVAMNRLKAQMAAQEAHWQDAYNKLLEENKKLTSSGNTAMLASQWRQRYEQARQETEALQTRLEEAKNGTDASSSAGNDNVEKYEAKYRDLKESFRLYRKKAKEIFESQQRIENKNGGSEHAEFNNNPLSPIHVSAGDADYASGSGNADAKLSYLKNLMVHYLTADDAVKEHMETAIGTVLQFTDSQREQIQQKKDADAWFY